MKHKANKTTKLKTINVVIENHQEPPIIYSFQDTVKGNEDAINFFGELVYKDFKCYGDEVNQEVFERELKKAIESKYWEYGDIDILLVHSEQ